MFSWHASWNYTYLLKKPCRYIMLTIHICMKTWLFLQGRVLNILFFFFIYYKYTGINIGYFKRNFLVYDDLYYYLDIELITQLLFYVFMFFFSLINLPRKKFLKAIIICSNSWQQNKSIKNNCNFPPFFFSWKFIN